MNGGAARRRRSSPAAAKERARGGLRGSTLVETLATMLVAGIVLAAVMEGLTLFFGLQLRQVRAHYAAMRIRTGFDALAAAVSVADSVSRTGPGRVGIYRDGEVRFLVLRDSTLLLESARSRDTLLPAVVVLRLDEYAGADTLTIGFAGGHTAAIPVRDAAGRYEALLTGMENDCCNEK